MPRSRWAHFDAQTRIYLSQDPELISFWADYFPSREDAIVFIKRCLKKITTRRMMLRVKWYVDIANRMPSVRDSRPALQIIFLVAMAESIAL